MLKPIQGTVAALLLALMPWIAAADDPPSAIHGFGEVSIKNDYITPRGLLVTNQGVTTQALTGLVFVTSSDTSLVAGIWNDINSDPAKYTPPSKTGAWNEFDYFIGFNYSPTKDLKLGVSYAPFLSPPGAFQTEQNIEFSANYSDPFKISPYVKLFYAFEGDSTVLLGKRGSTFDVEIGASPAYTIKALGVTLSAPTWITVGPSTYWCEQSSGAAGAAAGIKGRGCGSNNFGVFSTGLKASTPASFIPPQFGHWTLSGGVQYYNILNGALVDAQALTIDSPNGHRNVVVPYLAMGFGF